KGTRYKFESSRPDGTALAKADPLARAAEVPPATASVVTESEYSWSDDEWMQQRAQRDPHTGPMSIYEVHLGSWRQGLGYRELADQLPEYVPWMGVPHVALTPASQPPFGRPWGSQVSPPHPPTGPAQARAAPPGPPAGAAAER